MPVHSRATLTVITAFLLIGPASCRDGGAESTDAEAGDGNSAECNCGTSTMFGVHQPLSCLCKGSPEPRGCSDTLDKYDTASLCAQGRSVIRAEGCGKVSLSTGPNYTGAVPTFDAQTRRLVGVYEFSDIGFGDCAVHTYVYGEALFPADTGIARPQDVCAEIKNCIVCGPDSNGYPRCP